MSFSYQKTYPLTTRLNESNRILKKYPERIPIIMEKHASSTVPNLDQTKFLVPKELTVAQFIYVLRKRIKIQSTEALFIFINDSLPNSASMLSEIYDAHKNQDGFLYMTYASENTFG